MQQAGFPSETVSLTGRHYTQKWCSLTSQKYYVGLRDEYWCILYKPEQFW